VVTTPPFFARLAFFLQCSTTLPSTTSAHLSSPFRASVQPRGQRPLRRSFPFPPRSIIAALPCDIRSMSSLEQYTVFFRLRPTMPHLIFRPFSALRKAALSPRVRRVPNAFSRSTPFPTRTGFCRISAPNLRRVCSSSFPFFDFHSEDARKILIRYTRPPSGKPRISLPHISASFWSAVPTNIFLIASSSLPKPSFFGKVPIE